MKSVYDTPEWAAWLASIREMPDDDNRRLIAADFLDDNGEGERAEFIRVQVDLAQPKYKTKSGRPRLRLKRTARERERSILLSRAAWWTPGVEVVTSDRWRRTLGNTAVAAWYERGFITRASGPLVSLIGGACGCPSHDYGESCDVCNGTGRTPGVLRELVKREPVGFVEVTDRNPHPDAHDPLTHCGWIRFDEADRPDELPHDVYDALEGGSQRHDAVEWLHYPTADAARAALSAAILRLVQPVEVPK